MASKPKSRTFIVLRRGRRNGRCMGMGRFKVGARHAKEAIQLVQGVVGKHTKLRVYYEDPTKFMPHGIVIREC
ncbi:hypothetical protein ACFYKX_11295 [Cytobacillus sp. FJAT-54145]|uniref:50S ribosomal protein L16 n=1 Tax=Cytobacillus spartinae TaxID=3299023 RepID=A0ABW6KD48_9BACI